MAGDDGTTLPHLQGPAAGVRQAIAAYALKGLAHIVEVGGAGLPITRFLQHTPETVTVIDPKIVPLEQALLDGRPCRVRHIAAKLQAAALEIGPGSLGIALLGLSLKPLGGEPAVGERLVTLCRRADRVVIEHSLALDRALDQVPVLVREARLSELWSIDLTIRDGPLVAGGHGTRRLMVMQPGPSST